MKIFILKIMLLLPNASLTLVINLGAGFDKDFAEKTLYALMGIFPTSSNLAKLCKYCFLTIMINFRK